MKGDQKRRMEPTLAPAGLQEVGSSLTKLSVKGSEAKEHIFRSKLPDIELPNHMTLADYTFEKVGDNFDSIFLIDGPTGKEWTFRETQILTKKVAAGLTKLGIGKGDVIALLLPNCAEFVFCFLGAATLGSVISTCNPSYTEREVANQMKSCKAKLVVTQAAIVHKVQDLGMVVVTTDSPPEGALSISVLFDNDESDAPIVRIDSGELVCLPYSSGTSGFPKGVMLTHKSIVSSLAQQLDGENPIQHLTTDDAIICVLPMFHIYSLICILLSSLRRCCAIVIMQKYTTPHFLEMVQKYRVSVLFVVPPIVLAIVKSPIVEHYNLNSIRKVMCAAAPLGEDLGAKFQARFPDAIVGQGYGMTESGIALSIGLCFAKSPVPTKLGSCGTLVPNTEAKIVDPATGASYSHNQPGEIWVRGPQIMKGYLNNPEATAETIDKEGWLHTGDIAIIDEDEEVFIVDRLKEVIKMKGFQVPPAELEALLASHPNIADAGVVAKKDDSGGEVPVAFVVRTRGAAITEAEVKELISKQVVFYKRLHEVYFVESIPRNASGKILRKDLRLQL